MPSSDPPSHWPGLATAAPLPQLNRANGQPWLALLADDDPVNREVGVGMLQAMGLQVHTADDGQDALHKVQVLRYDLVLMDLQMPHLDGLSATRQLRALPQFSQLPVIAMTANTGAHSRQACMAAGMNDFLSKPIDIRLLADALMRCLPRT